VARNGQVIVRTENLTKRFGKIVAVNELNLEIHRGQIFGFLGPNGSGKTTTINVMLGLIRPTAGRVEIFGLDVKTNLSSILPRIGVAMDNPTFYPYLSGQDNLFLFAQVAGRVDKDRIKQALEAVELQDRAKDKFMTYSLGMKQRLAVAGALLNDPELVILDEPTKGLDPAGMKDMRDLMVRLGKEGKTIFLSSHLLHEVEQVCDHMGIIKQGKMLAQGEVSNLLRREEILEMRVTDPNKAMAILQQVDWVSSARIEKDLLLLKAPSQRAAEISAILARNDIFVSEMKTQESSLEDFFLEITGQE
jgi:ABC-2 type transport system ATP-binding protein